MTIVSIIPNHMYHVWAIIINGNREEYERWQQQIQMSVKIVAEDRTERNERKSSISTTTCEEDSPDSERTFRALLLPSIRQLRVELFKGDEQGGELSDKANRKAVSWLMTVCWSKDLGQECLWSAVLMYYSLKAQKKVQKDTLETTLMTCLSLSIKMFQTKSITLKDLTSSFPKPNMLQNIIETQASILQALEYNLIIPHLLSEAHCGGLEEEHLFGLMFVCEVLMLKNCAVFFDRERIEKIAEMVVRKSGIQMEGEREICKEVGAILGWKEAKIVVNKYSPKFDMDALRMKLDI